MSNLRGHVRITNRAVALLVEEGRPVYRALARSRVASNVVARDLIDVVILGHWMNLGQCHHFMRRFDGQSERRAYVEAIEWIRRNATDAARLLSRQLRQAPAPGEPGSGGRAPVRSATSSQALGNALHAVQDSFAWGHAEREEPAGLVPGAIRRIKRYAGVDKQGHARADGMWRGEGASEFSDPGWLAVLATKELLRLIVDSAMAAGSGATVELKGFEAYRLKWLRESDALGSA